MALKGIVCLLSVLASISSALYAGTEGNLITQPQSWPWIIDFSGGAAFNGGGQAQTLTLAPNITKSYTNSTNQHAMIEGALFLGVSQELQDNLYGQFGLSLGVANNARFTGLVLDDTFPNFANYSYEYHVRHGLIALKGKLIRDFGFSLHPWISASIGLGINQAYGFDNVPLIVEAVKMPNFTANTTSGVSYTLGVGLQKRIADNVSVGLGYEFSGWGHSQLGSAIPYQSIGVGLASGNIYTNALLLNVTFRPMERKVSDGVPDDPVF